MTTSAIEIRGLQKTFRGGVSGLQIVEALRGVDLTVQPGEIYGFLGPNGAGKSTTIKVLTRLLGPSAGTALVFGQPLDTPRARRRIGYLPENPVFYDYLTGEEFLRYYGTLAGLPRSETRRRSGELLERVGLGRAAKLQLRKYSKGMIQRIGIAQALLQSPDLIILDEPVSGLDPIGRREMRELMLEQKSLGRTIFFSTHIIQDVELVCDRVGIIIAGRMVREGGVAELLHEGGAVTEVVLDGLSVERARTLVPGATVRDLGSGVSIQLPPSQRPEDVLRIAIDAGARVLSLQTQRRPLEDLFIEQIAAQAPDSAPRASIRREEAA